MRNPFVFLSIIFLYLTNTLQAQPDTLLSGADSAMLTRTNQLKKDLVAVTALRVFQNGKTLLLESPGLEGRAALEVDGVKDTFDFVGGQTSFRQDIGYAGKLILFKGESLRPQLYHVALLQDGSYRIQNIPLWWSVVPPLVAILMALVFKEVVISLFSGIWLGAFIAGGFRLDSFYYFLASFFDVVQKYVLKSVIDSSHMSVILFSVLIGGMVAIISRNGGMAGIVERLSKYAKTAKSSQFITWLLGVAIFFDDYANTLIVGNTMRSVTDKFRVSREKLAYIVDSTAAPVAAVAFITTWIGAELGYIHSGTAQLPGFEEHMMTPYAVFLSSLKYSYYPAFTLIFILFLIVTQRDFGPMLQAERRARTSGEVSSRASASSEADQALENLDPVPGAPLNWYNAFIPVVLVILTTVYGLVDTGMTATFSDLANSGLRGVENSWRSIWASMGVLIEGDQVGFVRKLGYLIGRADSFVSLLWASSVGVLSALILTLSGRIMKITESINTMIVGFKTMVPAIIILILAWSLAMTTEELHTATYLTSALGDKVNPIYLPPIIFILASTISFSTGSSWSTMAILYPIAIPATWAISHAAGLDDPHSLEILLNVIATVLAASVLGDHCSPISDTTILSSLASSCNHIDHVRTQLPYALTVGLVSLLCGWGATALGGGWMVAFGFFASGIIMLYLIVIRLGKTYEN